LKITERDKMKKIISITFTFVLFLISPAFSQADPLNALLKAKTIRCEIKEGYTSHFNGKEISFEKGSFSKKKEDSILTLAKIDLTNSTAIAIGNAGTDDVVARLGETGINFVDFTGSGALIAATIFSNTDAEGNYFFVMSRHTQLSFGETTSMPSQWTGLCKIIE
jgi:hypothetical protein